MAVQTQIQTRRGSAATWTSTNPTLAAGEIGFESDTNKFKIGTGSTAWVSLPYASNVSPLTTKGDLYTYSTDNDRLAVGTTEHRLIADSAETTGLKYVADTTNYAVGAKGDLLAGTAADTVAALAVGNDGETLVADSATATGLAWNPAPNKNYLINGGFAVAQRGTSFTSGANNNDAYTLDRWYILSDTNDVIDVTQNTTTVPTNGEFAIALDVETVNKKFGIATIIENKDVIGLVGNTVTFSFKAKVSATTKLDNVKAAIVAWSGTADAVTSDIISAWGAEGTNPTLIANATYENTPANLSLTTSYATYSITAPVDTASTQNLILFIWSDVTDTTAGDFVYIAESKLELGSVATPFVYAGGTFQGELAACQRYYFHWTSASQDNAYSMIARQSDTLATLCIPLPTTMRTNPTLFSVASGASTFGRLVAYNTSFTVATAPVTAIAIGVFFGGTFGCQFAFLDITHGSTAGTFIMAHWDNVGSNTCTLAFSSEL
jgi:hypothetical protein